MRQVDLGRESMVNAVRTQPAVTGNILLAKDLHFCNETLAIFPVLAEHVEQKRQKSVQCVVGVQEEEVWCVCGWVQVGCAGRRAPAGGTFATQFRAKTTHAHTQRKKDNLNVAHA